MYSLLVTYVRYRHLSRSEKKAFKELFLDQELNPALENLLFLDVDE